MTVIQLRLKLFRCYACGWQGQTYTRPETTNVDCPQCSSHKDAAKEVPARMEGNQLVPIEPAS